MAALISIGIPARNGAKYVGSAIESVLSQPTDEIELVVSVDESEDDTLELVRTYHDERLRLIQPPKPMAMAEHYEWCLTHLSGEWVTLLGQDDALRPDFFRFVSNLVSRFPDAGAFSFRRAYFFWPGCESVYGDRRLDYHSDAELEMVETKTAVSEVLRGTREHYELPQIYTNNLVNSAVVQRVRDLSGGLVFRELTPDVYSGVAVALAAPTFTYVGHPVFWTGTSPSSTGFAMSSKFNKQAESHISSVRSQHLLAGEAAGLGTGDIVGMNLWIAADSSPIFVLASLHMVPYGARYQRSDRVAETAFAALGAQLLLSLLPGFDSRATRRQVWALAVDRVCERNLSRMAVYRKIPGLALRQLTHRVRGWRTKRRALDRVRIRGSVELGSIADANRAVESAQRATAATQLN